MAPRYFSKNNAHQNIQKARFWYTNHLSEMAESKKGGVGLAGVGESIGIKPIFNCSHLIKILETGLGIIIIMNLQLSLPPSAGMLGGGAIFNV